MNVKKRISEILDDNNNPFSVHPSRLKEWQICEALKELAEEIDVLKFTNKYNLEDIKRKLG
jgi:hypothetical protein